MIKFTDSFMRQSLDGFGEDYKYPVYAGVYCRTGFFSRRYNAQTGFTAVTDTEKLLVAEYSVLGKEKKYIFPAYCLKSLKIKKLLLLPAYSIKAVFTVDGRNFRLDMTVSLKVGGGNFPEQAENAVNFIETLKEWQI